MCAHQAHLPLVVRAGWFCLVQLGSLAFIKANNQQRYAKWPGPIALGVALQKEEDRESMSERTMEERRRKMEERRRMMEGEENDGGEENNGGRGE